MAPQLADLKEMMRPKDLKTDFQLALSIQKAHLKENCLGYYSMMVSTRVHDWVVSRQMAFLKPSMKETPRAFGSVMKKELDLVH